MNNNMPPPLKIPSLSLVPVCSLLWMGILKQRKKSKQKRNCLELFVAILGRKSLENVVFADFNEDL